MPQQFRRAAVLLMLALLAAFAPQARPARAADRHVTNTNDSGTGSLRAALAAAQSGDRILFDNTGALWTIQPLSALPTLSSGGVTIDGGADHKVVLDGSQLASSNIPANGLAISSSNNTIKGLVIVGFARAGGGSLTDGGAGIRIVGASAAAPATANTIVGNWIGVASDGTTGDGNSDFGILLDDHVTNTTIGGALAGEGNLIAGNGTTGAGANIAIFAAQFNAVGAGPISGNTVIGNAIGTTADGLAAIGGGNPADGIMLGDWAQNTTIGGPTVAERNIIAGHSYASGSLFAAGINVNPQAARPGSGNLIAGNYLGVNKLGTAAIPNSIGVILNGGTGTIIGGATASARNLISGNAKSGVLVRTISANSTIANNWIGLNASGAALGNGEQGVLVQANATGTTIGPGNVIAASGAEGVWLNTGGNIVKGNLIGTNSAGTASDATFSTGEPGVRIDAGTGNRVGGTTAADRNVIALSKQLVGIDIGGAASGSQVFGNYLGVNVSGTAVFTTAPPLGSAGIRISAGSTNNQIGNAAAGSGNILGGAYAGIKVENTTTGNLIKNNSVGVGAGGQNVGNSYYGIWLLDSSSSMIGGALGAEGNLVGYSGLYGIYADGANANNNTIAGNTVRNNGSDGVRVRVATGVKITQTQSSANGGNGIGLAVSGNASLAAPSNLQFTTVGGVPTLSGTTCAGCVVEVFTSPTRDDGEGPRYLATTTASGTSFSVAVPGCDPFLTATARDASNNTSPFTTPMLDAGPTCTGAQANVQLDPATPAAKTVAAGASATYVHTLHNTGTAQGIFTIAKSSTQPSWASQLSATSVALAPGASTAITLTVTPPANAQANAQDQTTITATVGNLSDQQTDTTTVSAANGVAIGPNRSGQVTPPGSIDYSHQITNTGNVSATIDLTETHTNPDITVAFPDGASCALAAGTSCTRHARITASAAASGADTTTITATVRGTNVTAPPVFDTTALVSAAVPQISSSASKSVLPGATATFTHTVTNIGNSTGQFTVTLANTAPAGWTFLYTPTAQFTLAPNATRTVTATIGPDAGASAPTAGSSATAQVRVQSSDGALASTTDSATALLVPALSFGPASQPTVNNALPGQTVAFTHTLTNLGNGTDSFTITVTAPAGWSADPIGPITLARGASQPVVVRVHVAGGQAPGSQTVTVSARTDSQPTPTPQTQTDTVNVIDAAVPKLSPVQTRNALTLPTILTFTHALTNTGNQTGTFALAASVTGAPAGWSAIVSPSSCNLAAGATCDVSVGVGVPAGASAGPQNIVLTASTTGPPASSISITDTVVVAAVSGLVFAPQQSSGSGVPGAVVTYTHTLTNTGNSTDSYTLTLAADPGWTADVSPTLLANLPGGAARTVQVHVRVPGGISAGSTGTVTTTATSAHAPFPNASVADRTTVSAKSSAALLPNTQSQVANPSSTLPDTVTFIHLLRNTGSISATYTLTKSDSLGWASTLTPTEVGPLLPNHSAMVTLTVTAPAGTPLNNPSNVTTLNVFDKDTPGPALASATDTTATSPRSGLLLTPALQQRSALPGATLSYVHTLRNTGATTDSFRLSTISPIGWNTSVAPSSISLPRDSSTTITVTVHVPTSALSGTLDMTTLSAQSVTDSGIFGTAEDQTRVQQVVGVNLSPSRFLPILPGTVMKFPHVLINTGNGKDTFALTATLKSGSTIAWPVAIQPITITLEPGASYQQIEVSVTVPPNIQPPLPTEIIVTAASQRNPAVRSQVTDMIGGIGQIEPRRFALFFPNVVHQQPTPTSSPMPTSTTVPGKGSVPTDTAMPTDTAVPTGTPMPTSTPVPTNVTEPTNSPTTGAPTEPPTGRATATPEP